MHSKNGGAWWSSVQKRQRRSQLPRLEGVQEAASTLHRPFWAGLALRGPHAALACGWGPDHPGCTCWKRTAPGLVPSQQRGTLNTERARGRPQGRSGSKAGRLPGPWSKATAPSILPSARSPPSGPHTPTYLLRTAHSGSEDRPVRTHFIPVCPSHVVPEALVVLGPMGKLRLGSSRHLGAGGRSHAESPRAGPPGQAGVSASDWNWTDLSRVPPVPRPGAICLNEPQ